MRRTDASVQAWLWKMVDPARARSMPPGTPPLASSRLSATPPEACRTSAAHKMAALTALANCDCPERKPALEQFYAKWQDEPLVVDKWLGVEALSRLPGTVARVKELTSHPAFTLKNPNKVYALLSSFCGNQVNFHAVDGSGYTFMAEQILALDPINPQVAARTARNFERWKRFEPKRRALMKAALKQIAADHRLSKETAEVVTKALT